MAAILSLPQYVNALGSEQTWPRVTESILIHDDVIKWKHFLRYWPFVRGMHRSPMNSPHKGQWHGALMFSVTSAWINDWESNREAGDLRRHRAHYDVTVSPLSNENICILSRFHQHLFLGPQWQQFKWGFSSHKELIIAYSSNDTTYVRGLTVREISIS